MDITLIKYDLISHAISYETVKALAVYANEACDVSFTDGLLVIGTESQNATFVTDVTIVYGEGLNAIEKQSSISYCGDFIVINAEVDYAKANNGGATIEVQGAKVAGSTIEVYEDDTLIASSFDGEGAITLNARTLCKLASGVHNLTVTNCEYSAAVALTIEGALSATDFQNANGSYEIFTADQVIDIINNRGTSAGLVYVLSEDIDLDGAEIATISEFDGTIIGNNYTISGYTVNGFTNSYYSAFIATNNGFIKDVTFAGTVNVAVYGKTNKTYYVAGVVANNNGSLENVHFAGTVNVEETGVNVGVKFYVGGVVSNTVIDDCSSADATLNVVVKFDSRIIKIFCDSSVNNVNVDCSIGFGWFTSTNEI
jgi:hypothetical protein